MTTPANADDPDKKTGRRKGIPLTSLSVKEYSPLTECVLVAVDNRRDGRLKPVVLGGERRIISESPIQRVVEELIVGVCALRNLFNDELRKRPGSCLGVQSCLRYSRILWSDNLPFVHSLSSLEKG